MTKLLADGKYYVTFKPVPSDLIEGSSLKIVCEPTDKPDKFNITKIIEYANFAAKTEGRSATLSVEDAEEYAATLLRKAIAIADQETPEWKDASEYPYLIATLIQVMHGKLMAEQIAANDAKKLKAYGKE